MNKDTALKMAIEFMEANNFIDFDAYKACKEALSQLKEPQYLPIEITEKGFTFNCESLFEAKIIGKYKIKLEVDDE